jgi:FAD:protein FMN transferase
LNRRPGEAGGPDRVVAFAARALGSALRLHLRLPDGVDNTAGPGAAAAAKAWACVLAEFAAVDLALSRFRDDSELAALNRLAGSGRVVAVSWRLRVALAAIHRAGRITDGRFDASVVDVLERIGEHGASLEPAPDDGTTARAAGGAPVRLARDGMARTSLVAAPALPVDTGGIGKGLALRWAAAAALPALPVGSGLLLDAGGDIVHAGEAPPDGGWRIGVDDPIAPPGADGPPVAVIALDAGAVATSSVGTRNWTAPDGRRVHHLVDPVTREPARTGLIAVTVAAPDPAWSEVWSKALFLGGRDSIGEEARRRGFAAWWIDDRGRLGMTPAARVRSVWIDEDRVA